MYIPLIRNGSAGAGNGSPSLETDGVPIRRGGAGLTMDQGLSDDANEASILVEADVTASTVGSVAYVRYWAWFPKAYGADKWFPLGSGADADKGKLNADGGYSLGETGTNKIRHTEIVRGFQHATRLYAEYGALTNIVRLDVTAEARE